MEITFFHILVVTFAVLLGGLVHGTLGIGFPLVATPLVALVTDVRTAIIVLLIPTITVNVASIVSGGKFTDVARRFWYVVFSIGIGSYIGTSLLVTLDPNPFRLLLALVLLFYIYTRNSSPFTWSFIQRKAVVSGTMVGTAAGFLAGTVNITMPPLFIYFSEMRLTTTQLIQILNVCFLMGKVTQTATFVAHDALDVNTLLLSLPFSVVAVSVLRFGISIRQRIDAETYRRWLMTALKVITAGLIIQFIAGIHGG